MSTSALPRFIDPRKFSQQAVSLGGTVAFSELSRLADVLVNTDGQLTVSMRFGVDEGTRYVNGELAASLPVTCQRCLEPMVYELSTEIHLAMLWREDQASSIADSWDPWVVGEGQVDLYAVIEDEVIINLPHVAYHQEMCIPDRNFHSGESVTEDKSQQPNPFDVLAGLKVSLSKPTSEK